MHKRTMSRSKLYSILSVLTPSLKRKDTASNRRGRASQSLDGLPVDIILAIFLHLDFVDVLSLAQVRIHTVLCSSVLL